ncbi:MAG: hypothetical protein OXG68_06580 [Chloroflexi bacterium]|nr:hypothetical protein [Chloroflexota bacterium]
MQQSEQISYRHYSRCHRLWNDEVDLLVTGDFGPRVIRFGFKGVDGGRTGV